MGVKREIVATFSIVGFDPAAQEWGIAVQSKFVAVGGPFALGPRPAWGNRYPILR